MEEKKSGLPKLVEIILNDKKLENIATTYVGQANLFLSNFEENLRKTSVQLSGDFPMFDMDAWKLFLTEPTIKKYLDDFRNESIGAQATAQMITGDKAKDAMQIKTKIEQANGNNNQRLVILRMPDKKDEPEYE